MRDDGAWRRQWYQPDHMEKKSAPRYRQLTTPTPRHSIFAGRMLFLMPDQQRPSTEGNSVGPLVQVKYAAVDGLGQQLGRYANWMSNKPAVENNDCVALASESRWQWTDENCDFAFPFVCETGRVFHLLQWPFYRVLKTHIL